MLACHLYDFLEHCKITLDSNRFVMKPRGWWRESKKGIYDVICKKVNASSSQILICKTAVKKINKCRIEK